MPEVVKNVLSGMSLGILGYDFVYPVAPKSPFKEAKRALSNDRQIIERHRQGCGNFETPIAKSPAKSRGKSFNLAV